MRLYIAEKPSLGRVIASALSSGTSVRMKREKNHIVMSNGDIVAWSAGHILSQAMPEAYGEQYKKWDLESLPCIPGEWIMQPKKETKDLFTNIKKLLKDADEVVNAGDADREGQLLIDEILDFCEYHGPVYRLLISDTNIGAVKKALKNMMPNREFLGLKHAALARSRADWMHGLNMTRAYTVLARRGGFDDVVRIGRVKTPTTALVVERDRIIENFVPVDYFDLIAKMAFGDDCVRASWQPKETQEGLDSEGRLTDKDVAFALADRLTGQEARVTEYSRKKKNQKAPVGFSLPELQIEASKRFGFPAHETLKICQELYEAGILTYPRSDCQYLPEGHHGDAEAIVQNIDSFLGLNKLDDERLDLSRKHPVFNSGKVEEHHAIIPTVEPKTRELKGAGHAKIFLLVSLRYLSWFFPDYTYYADAASFDIGGENFKATGKEILDDGWKALFKEDKTSRRLKSAKEDAEEGGEEEEGSGLSVLPALEKGQVGTAEEVLPAAKQTKPPARFTEASLLKAMNTVHRFVKDPKIKEILKETDGIGTAATQAKIIKDLFDSGHLIKKGKKVHSSPTARALIDILPAEMTVPDLTALWEKEFQQIQKGERGLEDTLQGIREKVTSVVETVRGKDKITLPGNPGGGKKKAGGSKGKKKGKGGERKTGGKCPFCGAVMVQRKGKHGMFWGCSKYPECKGTLPDENGKPGKRRSA